MLLFWENFQLPVSFRSPVPQRDAVNPASSPTSQSYHLETKHLVTCTLEETLWIAKIDSPMLDFIYQGYNGRIRA